MVLCAVCQHTFPLLDAQDRCSKCQARKPGMSVIDIQTLNVQSMARLLLLVAH